jgi:hypothetical protein
VHVGIGLALLLCANLVTYWTSGYFEKLRDYRSRVDAVFTRPGVRVLVAGDSHIAVPLNGYVNGARGGAAYSIAFGGDAPRECFAKIRYILDRCATIDTVIVTADPHMFGSGRLESSNRSFADLYFLAAADGAGLKRGWLPALLDQVPLFNDDFVQYLRKMISKTATSRFSGARGGTRATQPVPWEQLPETERTARACATGVMDHKGVGEHPEPFFWYSQLLDLARAHSVRVIGVRFPVHHAYAAQIAPERVAAIDDFLRQHGMAAILDLRDQFTDPAYFDDADHVKKEKAEALVRVLEERLGVQLKVAQSAAGRNTAAGEN